MEKKEKIFLSVLEKHKGIIYKVAQTYCFDKLDREDLIQEIIFQVWKTLDNYNEQYKWSTWIYRIALNTSISFYRKHKTRREKTDRLSPILEVSIEDAEPKKDSEIYVLRKCIHELKELDRALILLYLDGLSSKEIAEIINTSPSNVTSKISRIKKKLKIKLEEINKNEHG